MGNKQAQKILEVLDLDYSCFEPRHQTHYYPKDKLVDKNFYSNKFELFPDPWELSRIAPELVVYRRNFRQKSVSYTKNEKLLIKELIESNYLTTSRVVFITHGFLCDRTTDWISILKSEILNTEDCTVITLEWRAGARLMCHNWSSLWYSYEQLASNALEVGKWLSRYLIELRKRCKHINIYCIGHCLGAHLFGNAAKWANKLSGTTVIDRISGLDPAGPGFQTTTNSQHRLCKSDAKFVDVIHTDGWGYDHYFGSYLPMGTIDFYPTHYKGFGHSLRSSNLKSKSGLTAAHNRAIDLFIWSINRKNSFKTNRVLLDRPAVECLTYETRRSYVWLQMGYHSDKWKDLVDSLHDTWYLVNAYWQIPCYI